MQHVSQFPQIPVSLHVPLSIVDLLEIVQVQNGHTVFRLRPLPRQRVHHLLERLSVPNAGQRIRQRLYLEMLLLQLTLDADPILFLFNGDHHHAAYIDRR